MPVDFVDLKKQIRDIAAKAPAEARRVGVLRGEAAQRLVANAERGAELRAKVEQAAAADTWLRSAKPVREALTAAFSPPKSVGTVTLIAADGSQITPSRHDALSYFLINIGAISMVPESGQVPVTYTKSTLHYLEYSNQGSFTGDQVNQLRDTEERTVLAELVADTSARPLITLTDGPLELWGGRDREPEQQAGFLQNLESYKAALRQVQAAGAITAGYEDKSHRDLVVRMLEISALPSEQLATARQARPYRGVLDKDLFSTLLQSGERSAIFEIQHQLSASYSDVLSLHFFYLNVGSSDAPWLARVEIPAWVADKKESVDILHAVLMQQCRITPAAPFPYALHRADEVARVTHLEKREITNLLLAELAGQGITGGAVSHKQSLKDTAFRGRE